jgi:hypothetical protein
MARLLYFNVQIAGNLQGYCPFYGEQTLKVKGRTECLIPNFSPHFPSKKYS